MSRHWEINPKRLLPFKVQRTERIRKRHLVSSVTHITVDPSTGEVSEGLLKSVGPAFGHKSIATAIIERK